MMQSRGAILKIITVPTLGLVLSGCTIGPLTLPDLPNPFVQKSLSGPEISTSNASPSANFEYKGEVFDVSSDQVSRTIQLKNPQKLTFTNTGKTDVLVTFTLDRDIPVTIVAGTKFVFNFTQRELKVAWKSTTLNILNTAPTPTKAVTVE